MVIFLLQSTWSINTVTLGTHKKLLGLKPVVLVYTTLTMRSPCCCTGNSMLLMATTFEVSISPQRNEVK